MILETERTILREIDTSADAEFVLELLNTPKFIEFIGDRGVRSISDARDFIDTRFRAGYREHGYGLYAVSTKDEAVVLGICGFVRRDTLPGPDIGFAFLPAFEGKGFGTETAAATLAYGRDKLGFTEVYAITDKRNAASQRLLEKIGLRHRGETASPSGEPLDLFHIQFQSE